MTQDFSCKKKGHKQEFHSKACNGKYRGYLENDESYSWCIANCEKFWK